MSAGDCNCMRRLIPPYTPDTYGASVQRCAEHGDPSLPPCPDCGGKGAVYGKNRDDPLFWSCVTCKGTGVAAVSDDAYGKNLREAVELVRSLPTSEQRAHDVAALYPCNRNRALYARPCDGCDCQPQSASARRCADCGQPISDDFPGREWGGPRWAHIDLLTCVAALGAIVRALEAYAGR